VLTHAVEGCAFAKHLFALGTGKEDQSERTTDVMRALINKYSVFGFEDVAVSSSALTRFGHST